MVNNSQMLLAIERQIISEKNKFLMKDWLIY